MAATQGDTLCPIPGAPSPLVPQALLRSSTQPQPRPCPPGQLVPAGGGTAHTSNEIRTAIGACSC